MKRSERRTDGVTIGVTIIDKEIFLSKKAALLRSFFPIKNNQKERDLQKANPFQNPQDLLAVNILALSLPFIFQRIPVNGYMTTIFLFVNSSLSSGGKLSSVMRTSMSSMWAKV